MSSEPMLFFFITAAVANLALTPLAIHLSHKHGFLDRPGHRKIHRVPVAKLGGVALLASILLSVALGLFFFGHQMNLGRDREVKIVLILSVTLLAAVLGFFDDLYDLRPRHKLALQTLLLGAFVLLGFQFQVLHIPGLPPFGLSYLAFPLTLFWLLAIVNGFNFMDGIDGLAGLVTAVSLGGLGVAATILNGGINSGILWVPALGSVFVFLFFNWKPAKIYLGDAGTSALGTLMAISLVGLGSSRPALLSFFEPHAPVLVEPFRFHFLVATLIVGYPALEVGLSTLRRASKRFFFGRSMEQSEKEHIHHHLLKLGLGTGTICWLAALFQLVLAAGGLLAMGRQNALAIWLLGPLFMFLAFLGPRTGFLDFLKMKHAKAKPHFQIANHFISMQRVKLQLAHNREEVLALVSQTCREFGVKSCRLIIKADKHGRGGMDYFREWGMDLSAEYLDFIHDSTQWTTKGFSDHYKLTRGRGGAHWVFEPQTKEEELDVEYHVLVNDFMREALEIASRLGVGQETLELPTTVMLPHHKTSGQHLRKGHNAKLN